MPKSKVNKLVERGTSAHELGELTLAENLYNKVLKIQPQHPDANHNLGVIKVLSGRLDEAVLFFTTAVNSNPSISQFWYSLIDALIKKGDIKQAIKIMEKARSLGASGKVFDDLEKKFSSLELTSQKPIQSYKPPAEKIEALLKLVNADKLKDAEYLASQMLVDYPSSPELHNLGGTISIGLGKIDSAVRILEEAVKLKPNFSLAYYNLGNAFKKRGDSISAIHNYEKAIKFNRIFPEALLNLGNVYLENEELERAKKNFEASIKINPSLAEAFCGRGLVFHKCKKYESAIEDYKRAIELKPNFSVAFANLGNLHFEVGQVLNALKCYDLALDCDPRNIDALINSGIVNLNDGRFVTAIEYFTKAIGISPQSQLAKLKLGIAFNENGSIIEATDCFNELIDQDPDNFEAHFYMGVTQKNSGDIEGACQSYKNAIALKPDFVEAHRHLSTINKYNKDHPHLKQMEELANGVSLTEPELCHLQFALAKAHEDAKEYHTSYNYYVSANALRKNFLNYDISNDKNFFRLLKLKQKDLYSKKLTQISSSLNVLPIFILGMPRSGTTLLEQILSQHSQIKAAGELDFTSRNTRPLIIQDREINKEDLAKYRAEYLQELKSLSNGKCYVTDKMPHNFLYIPFILSAIPEAKIIHVSRDAAATCWSNFKHYFTAIGLGYCTNLSDTVTYYKMYRDLMDLWEEKYKDNIILCDYEELTASQVPKIKDIISSLSLPWEDGCLNPQYSARSVRTASQQQVRKEIYKNSSKDWLKFEGFIGDQFMPLKI